MSIPDNPNLKLVGSLSIEGWINSAGNLGFILFRGDNRPGLDPYSLTLNESGNLQFHIASLTEWIALQAPIAHGEWKHVAATLDDDTGAMRLYVDGALAAETNTTVRPMADLDPQYEPALGIGDHGGTFHRFPFRGLIDEISLYSRALSAEEIGKIFRAGAAGKCVSATDPMITQQPEGGMAAWEVAGG